MPYVLGIDIGDSSLRAAVSRVAGAAWSPPEPVRLDAPSFAIPAVLYIAADGSWAVGDPVLDSAAVGGDRIARGFLRRVGDDIPLAVGSQPTLAQTLVAMMVMWVVERAISWEDARPEHVVLSHPAGWGLHRRELLHEAVWHMGLTEVTLLPEPVVAAEGYLDSTRPGQTFGVYAMDGAGYATSVVRRTEPEGFELLGCLDGIEPFGAEDIEAAQAYPDPEEAIRPAVEVSVDTLVETVRTAGLQPDQLDGVLLVGTTTRAPLITDALDALFPGRVMRDADPEFLVANGAAQAAVRVVAPPAPSGPYDYEQAAWPAALDSFDGYPPKDHPETADEPPRPPVRISKLALPRRSRLHAR